MTIKEFAKLCDCNPQTLRYYDKQDLLKPDAVDDWTGYRYYKEEQALDYVKIKNLQEADFSIKEIKELLTRGEEEIYHAFDRKIREQQAKLEQMKKIQKAYLSERQSMEAKIQEIKDAIIKSAKEYNPQEEFGISEEMYEKLIGNVMHWLDDAGEYTNALDIDFSEVCNGDLEEVIEEAEFINPLADETYEVMLEKHYWEKTKEALEAVPQLEDGEYFFYFEVKHKDGINMAFCNIVLGMALEANPGKHLNLNCNYTDSKDEKNHFWLLKKK